MSALLVAALLAIGIAAPHAIDLRRAPAGPAALVWGAALGLRAAGGALAAVIVALALPATAAFQALTHWCWHTAVPLVAAHLGLDGHSLGGAVALLPAALLGASAISIAWGALRATRAIRRAVRRHGVARGPQDSLLIADRDVVLAAIGLRRPQVMVSTGALGALDDEELAAGLAHERGHIARGHRWLLLYAEICRALGGPIPGGRRAAHELAFHLERDADAWALRRRHDPLALAGAICKAALGAPDVSARAPVAGSAAVRQRVGELVAGPVGARGHRLALARGTAVLSVALLLSLVAALPVAATTVSPTPAAIAPHC